MPLPPLSFPVDLASAHAALPAEREARLLAEAEATNAKAKLSSIGALNAHLHLRSPSWNVTNTVRAGSTPSD